MKNRGFFPFFVQFVVCTRLSQSVTASQKHFKSSSLREKPYYCCEIRRFSQRKVDLVLVAALPTRRERKMPNDSTAQKSKNQKNSGSTTGSTGANKDRLTRFVMKILARARVRDRRKEWRENLPATKAVSF